MKPISVWKQQRQKDGIVAGDAGDAGEVRARVSVVEETRFLLMTETVDQLRGAFNKTCAELRDKLDAARRQADRVPPLQSSL